MITLNVNGLNAPTKGHRLARWMKLVHVCTSTYHTLLDPPIVYNYFILFNYVSIMACNCNELLFFVWLLIVKTDKHLLLW